MKSIINSPYALWMLLALPSIPMLIGLLTGGGIHQVLHPTGEFAARFMIIAMIISPFRLMFPKNGFWLWMVRRRRYFGVAAFSYAFVHTLFYLIDVRYISSLLEEFFELGIWTGWLAMFIFGPLAITSNDWSVKFLGKNWKRLQQTVYIAALATLGHWIFIENHLGPALVHFMPLAALELYRIWKIKRSPATV